MSFPVNLHFLCTSDRARTVVIEEILQDSLKINHDIMSVQTICEKLEEAKTQEERVKYILQIQTQLTDIVTTSQQVYSDIKELMHY